MKSEIRNSKFERSSTIEIEESAGEQAVALPIGQVSQVRLHYRRAGFTACCAADSRVGDVHAKSSLWRVLKPALQQVGKPAAAACARIASYGWRFFEPRIGCWYQDPSFGFVSDIGFRISDL